MWPSGKRVLRTFALRPGAWRVLAAVGLLLAVFGAGCSGKSGPTDFRSAAPLPGGFAAEEGGRLYSHYCQLCHGESGQGNGRYYASSLEPPPADFSAPSFVQSMTEAQLRRAIVGGSAAMGKSDLCPAWGKTFAPKEVDYLIAHIRQLQNHTETSSANALQ